MSAYTPVIGERLASLLTDWKLSTLATELVPRFTAAGHDEALTLLAEVFELEADARKERRVDRLRRASKLPPAKSFDSLDRERVPRPAFLKIQELAGGDFLDRANNRVALRIAWRRQEPPRVRPRPRSRRGGAKRALHAYLPARADVAGRAT